MQLSLDALDNTNVALNYVSFFFYQDDVFLTLECRAIE